MQPAEPPPDPRAAGGGFSSSATGSTGAARSHPRNPFIAAHIAGASLSAAEVKRRELLAIGVGTRLRYDVSGRPVASSFPEQGESLDAYFWLLHVLRQVASKGSLWNNKTLFRVFFYRWSRNNVHGNRSEISQADLQATGFGQLWPEGGWSPAAAVGAWMSPFSGANSNAAGAGAGAQASAFVPASRLAGGAFLPAAGGSTPAQAQSYWTLRGGAGATSGGGRSGGGPTRPQGGAEPPRS